MIFPYTFTCISNVTVVASLRKLEVSVWCLVFQKKSHTLIYKHMTLVTVAVTDGAETLHPSFHLPVFSTDFSISLTSIFLVH